MGSIGSTLHDTFETNEKETSECILLTSHLLASLPSHFFKDTYTIASD